MGWATPPDPHLGVDGVRSDAGGHAPHDHNPTTMARIELVLGIIAATTGSLAILGMLAILIYYCRNLQQQERGKTTTTTTPDTSMETVVAAATQQADDTYSVAVSQFDDAWSYAVTECGSELHVTTTPSKPNDLVEV